MKIKAQNTLAWGKKAIEIDFDTKGLTLIKGKNLSSKSKSTNGVGKSTILNTLLYARYGVYPDGFKKADMINDTTKNNSVVEYWETRHGKSAYIVRGIKCQEMEFNGIEIIGDFLLFFLDNKDMRGSTTTATQDVINKFLEVDVETFKIAALFSSTNESFAGKTSSKQDEVFSKILHLEKLEIARLKVRDQQKDIKQEIIDIDTQIDKLNSHIVREENRLETVTESKRKWLQAKQSRLDNLENKITTLLRDKVSYEKQNKSTKNELKEAEVDLKNLEVEIKKINDTQLKEDKNRLRAELSKLDLKIGEIKGNIRRLITEIKQAQGMNGVAICPKCFGTVDKEHLYSIIEEKNITKDNNENNLVQIQESRNKAYTALQRVETSIRDISNRLNTKVATTALISRLNGRIESNLSRILNIESNLQDTLKRKEKLEQELPPQSEDTKGIEFEINKLKVSIDTLLTNRDKLQINSEDLDFCLKMFGSQGIRNLLIRSVIPELNNSLVKFADILTNGELVITFTGETEVGAGKKLATRNKMQVKVEDRFGSNKYGKLSNGEKRRVDLCVSLALNQLLSTRVGLNFLMNDEIFISTDGRGKEKIMELLNYLLGDIPCLFVISNQDDIVTDSFDNIWTVIRKGKESYIEFTT